MASKISPQIYKGDILTVNISSGLELATFHIHKALPQQNSPYFQAIENFEEGKENIVRLNDVEPTHFRHLTIWMYEDVFSVDENFVKTAPHDNYRFYAVADRLMMPNKYKNMAMDKIRKYHTTSPIKFDEVDLLAELELPYTNPLIKYFTEQFAYDWLRFPGSTTIESSLSSPKR